MWIQTYSGRQFDLTDPSSCVYIRDIAHALSNVCRFAGHTNVHYSVAQHCVLVSQHCKHALWGLLHDAAEAYIGDVPRPVKRVASGVQDLETVILKRIAEQFRLEWPIPEEVCIVDRRISLDEKRCLMGKSPVPWTIENFYKPLDIEIVAWSPAAAEQAYLKRFKDILTFHQP